MNPRLLLLLLLALATPAFAAVNALDTLITQRNAANDGNITYLLPLPAGGQTGFYVVNGVTSNPDIATLGTGLVFDSSTKVISASSSAPQVQSDYAQTNNAAVDFIKNKPAARLTGTVTRSFNSSFRPSVTRDSLVSYSVEIAATLSLTAGQTGTVFLEVSPDNSAWTEIARVTNGNTGALTIGLNLTQTVGLQVGGYVPIGYYVRLRSTGVPPTYRSGQETLL